MVPTHRSSRTELSRASARPFNKCRVKAVWGDRGFRSLKEGRVVREFEESSMGGHLSCPRTWGMGHGIRAEGTACAKLDKITGWLNLHKIHVGQKETVPGRAGVWVLFLPFLPAPTSQGTGSDSHLPPLRIPH